MPTRLELHPTARTAAYAISIGLIVSFGIIGAKRILRADATSNAATVVDLGDSLRTIPGQILLPVIDLRIADAQLESNWSAALATALAGETEAPVEGGRVDVLTEHYAIEVDRLDKWHEAIGQASHYALRSKKIPVAALMIPSDLWPLSPTTKSKLLLIDETCTSKGIKVVLLRRIDS
ncbi:MAG: hypothetical protein RLZZ505_2992 [Verrucomicrobiota bacterium]|jgi:hypothetical protein